MEQGLDEELLLEEDVAMEEASLRLVEDDAVCLLLCRLGHLEPDSFRSRRMYLPAAARQCSIQSALLVVLPRCQCATH